MKTVLPGSNLHPTIVVKPFLDVGCGKGGKLVELVSEGAGPLVGVDIDGNFLVTPTGLELLRGDLSDLSEIRQFEGRK